MIFFYRNREEEEERLRELEEDYEDDDFYSKKKKKKDNKKSSNEWTEDDYNLLVKLLNKYPGNCSFHKIIQNTLTKKHFILTKWDFGHRKTISRWRIESMGPNCSRYG